MTCEEKVAQLEAENAGLQTDLGNAEMDLRTERRRTQAWKNKFMAKEALDPTNAEIRSLLEYWHKKVGRNGRTKLPLDGDRAKRVRWALKHYEPETIREVIDKLALYPYVWKVGQRSERRPYGTREQRSDDITAALYSEKTIEKFQALGEPFEPDERLVTVPARVIDEMRRKYETARSHVQFERDQGEADAKLVLSLAAQVEVLVARVAELEEPRMGIAA